MPEPAPAPRPELRRDRPADVRYIVGSPGSGKSWYVQQLLRGAGARGDRALVWDFKDDHHELATVESLQDLARRALAEPVLRYLPRYVNIAAQFNLFCQMAWVIQAADPSRDMWFVVEELPEVTSASHAAEWWRRIVLQGRVYGFTVLATAQRPALVDKSFTGSATLIRSGRLGELSDAIVIGRRIGVEPELLQRLPDRQAYVFDGRRTRMAVK